MLISEPGVSRIAVVKGLAIRIARGDVVAPIRGKRIVELPMDELARATPSCSQLAQGLQQAIEEASRNPAIILFIDEMHTVVGTEWWGPRYCQPAQTGIGEGQPALYWRNDRRELSSLYGTRSFLRTALSGHCSQ